MKKEDYFYLVVVLTVVFERFLVFIYPSHLIIGGLLIHHFWVGLLLGFFGFLISSKYFILRFLLLVIGLGLMIDEFVFMILGGGSFPEYWSSFSVISVIVLLTILFYFRKEVFQKLF